jgi:hypothetical protein
MIVKFFLEIENVVGVACPIWFMMLLLIIPPTSTYLLSVRTILWQNTILKQLVKSHHSTSICRHPVAKPTGGNIISI